MSTADESASCNGVVLTLPDGSIRKFDGAVSGAELAADIGPGLAKAAIAIVVDGEVRDLTRKIKNDSDRQRSFCLCHPRYFSRDG